MRWLLRRFGAIGVLVGGTLGLTVLALAPLTVAAHEGREVGDGQYTVEVGFLNEPAYLGQPNGLYLEVSKFATGGVQPVEGLAATLSAEVQKDGQTLSLALVPQAEPGVYHATFFPTAIGDYTFRISGQIEGATIDESFTSSPTTFNAVEPIAGAQFPVQPPSDEALAQRITDAEDEASGARTLGIAGLVLGILGVIIGSAGLALSRRRVSSAGARSR